MPNPESSLNEFDLSKLVHCGLKVKIGTFWAEVKNFLARGIVKLADHPAHFAAHLGKKLKVGADLCRIPTRWEIAQDAPVTLGSPARKVLALLLGRGPEEFQGRGLLLRPCRCRKSSLGDSQDRINDSDIVC